MKQISSENPVCLSLMKRIHGNANLVIDDFEVVAGQMHHLT